MRASAAVRISTVLACLVVQLVTACAPAPVVVDPPVRAADLDEIEDYMISLWACYPSDWFYFPPEVSTEVVELVLFGRGPSVDFHLPYVARPDIRACVLGARGDCDAIMACLGVERPARLTEEECYAMAPHCEGDVRVACIEGAAYYLFRQDRRAVGETCEQPPPESCDWVGPRCLDASTSVRCDDGLRGPVETCRVGYACTTDGPTEGCDSRTRRCWSGVCLPAGPSCDRDHCDGDTLVFCDLVTPDGPSREATRYDCASGGMRCAENDLGGMIYAQCVGTLGECEPGPATCDGTTLTYCAPDGSVRRYDCVEHGFARCDGERVGSALCAPEVPWTER